MIFCDIEALPDLGAAIRLVQPVNKRLSAAKSIAAWEADHPPDDSAWRSTSLDRLRLRVLCIGWAIDDGPVHCLTAEYPSLSWLDALAGRDPERVKVQAMLDDIEAGLIHQFSDALAHHVNEQWCGWHCDEYDWPALWIRAVRYGAAQLRASLPSDKWAKGSRDLMQAWKGTDYRGEWVSCDNAVRYLGGEVQTGINGSEVFDAWNAGRVADVEAHCRADIDDLRFVASRLSGQPLATRNDPDQRFADGWGVERSLQIEEASKVPAFRRELARQALLITELQEQRNAALRELDAQEDGWKQDAQAARELLRVPALGSEHPPASWYTEVRAFMGVTL